MRPHVRAFRDAAAQACRDDFASFMRDRGLEDILKEADANNWSPQEIASVVLTECCLEDGVFNNFIDGVYSVMLYLNQFVNLGQGREQAYKDLADILRGPSATAG